jgi:hypothetical protein
MKTEYHILNGDALKERFPSDLPGEIIVARECLVDGDVNAASLEDFFELRSTNISNLHPEYSPQDYYHHTVSEFEKIRRIPTESTVNLWFEDDLFCQVNLWFICSLLFNYTIGCHVFLVRPAAHDQYGFGGLSESELKQAYDERVEIEELEKFAYLWECYQKNDLEALIQTATGLKQVFPFILPAVEAHIARIPTDTNKGRPLEALEEIMEELGTDEFAPVFRAFNKRERIYGFSDLQVHRLLEKIKTSRNKQSP